MDFREHLALFMDNREVENLINSLSFEPTHAFMVNNLKINDCNSYFNNYELIKHPYINNAYKYDKNKYELGKTIEFEQGAYYIQDSSAMMSIEFLNLKAGDRVLDMCAAPGGKSFDALLKIKDKGLLVCNDLSSTRAKILSSNIEKYGFSSAIVLNDNSKNYKKNFLGFFDKIILDAPCSGSAMFRKNELAKSDWSIEKVLECQKIQKELIEDAYIMLKEGGELLYSTCSFSKQENEDVIKDFINNHPDMEIIPISLNKELKDTYEPHGGLRLDPTIFDGEGQTIYHLRKNSPVLNIHRKILNSSRLKDDAKKFLDSINFKYDKEDIILLGNRYYYTPFIKLDLKGLNICRYGLELGEMIKDRFEPSHALARYQGLDSNNFIELQESEAKDYLKGLEIRKEGSSGYKVVSYKGLALGWVKHVNNTLKNHYPKGLRHNF